MRHRSTVAFIILAAALFAAPQMAHDVLSLKSAFGARLRGEMVRALLNLGAGVGSEEIATRQTGAGVLASARENTDAQAAPKSKGCERRSNPSPQSDAQPQKESREHLAMLVSPSLITEGSEEKTSEAGESAVDPSVVDTNVYVGRAAEVSQPVLAQGEPTLLAPQDAVVVAPVRAVAGEKLSARKSRARQNKKGAEAEREAAMAAACFAGRKFERRSPDAALLRSLASLIPASYQFKVDGAQRVRFVRVVRRGGATPVSYLPQLPKQVALNVPAPALTMTRSLRDTAGSSSSAGRRIRGRPSMSATTTT